MHRRGDQPRASRRLKTTIDGGGTELRSVVLPVLGMGHSNANDVVIALDGAVYLGGFEYGFSPADVVGASRGTLVELPPA